jgi:hypothetical protein
VKTRKQRADSMLWALIKVASFRIVCLAKNAPVGRGSARAAALNVVHRRARWARIRAAFRSLPSVGT